MKTATLSYLSGILAVMLTGHGVYAAPAAMTMNDLAGQWNVVNIKTQIKVNRLGNMNDKSGNGICTITANTETSGSFICYDDNWVASAKGSMTLSNNGKKLNFQFNQETVVNLFQQQTADWITETLYYQGEQIDPESVYFEGQTTAYQPLKVKNSHSLLAGSFTLLGRVGATVNNRAEQTNFRYRTTFSFSR